MGKRSDLSVSQRREVVLMLLWREEPAARRPERRARARTTFPIGRLPSFRSNYRALEATERR
jgi:hypothetical protein